MPGPEYNEEIMGLSDLLTQTEQDKLVEELAWLDAIHEECDDELELI